MQRKVPVGSVSFNQNWAAYRDGFGSATGNYNYWLGLDKVYSLMQLYSVKLRVEVDAVFGITSSFIIAVSWFRVSFGRKLITVVCWYQSMLVPNCSNHKHRFMRYIGLNSLLRRFLTVFPVLKRKPCNRPTKNH